MAIELIDKIKPKNGGSFPMVDAGDVLMPNGQRLNDYAEATASKEYVQEYVQENTPSVPEDVATETYVQNYINEFAAENMQGIATETYVQQYVESYIEDALGGDY